VGFLALDPRDGQVRAWVGSRDFQTDPFDHVAQARRQPGSTFKPFVYGAAFDKGMQPGDTLIDREVEIPLPDDEVWRPTDESPPSGKPVSLRDGLVYSRNRITAQLMDEVGPARVARLAKKMGVRQSPLEEVPSLALGTSPVTLKEMVAAYGTLANGGGYIEPVLITRIEDRSGQVLEEFAPLKPEAALDPGVAYTLLDVMRGVVDRGTGVAIRNQFGLRADLAGKTGTTQDNTDGWFILMHPQLVAGAWVGFNDNRITLRSDYWGQGARSALPIVGDTFHYALANRLIEPRQRFVSREEPGLLQRGWRWVRGLWATPEPEPEPRPAPRRPRPQVPSPPASPPPVPAEPVPAPSPPSPPPGGEAPPETAIIPAQQ
jgi:penicillin-binding protein 1A